MHPFEDGIRNEPDVYSCLFLALMISMNAFNIGRNMKLDGAFDKAQDPLLFS
jgi:hypothetical protein